MLSAPYHKVTIFVDELVDNKGKTIINVGDNVDIAEALNAHYKDYYYLDGKCSDINGSYTTHPIVNSSNP
uniref:Uncharacterized protein n=1 Tax=Meloidogyne javanica TaxID=6303 RepID=A0A915MEM6_MELJA